MKKLLLILLTVLYPFVGIADDPPGRYPSPFNEPYPQASRSVFADDNDIELVWSYAALADTINEMNKQCNPVSIQQLTAIGNWVRNNGAKFSKHQLAWVCKQTGLRDINRAYIDDKGNKLKCELPTKNCHNNNCGEVNYTPFAGCNIFITTFIDKNEQYRKILSFNKPGTYVKIHNPDKVYKIIDVVLANDYWVNNEVNLESNTSDKNTMIYVVDNGNITPLLGKDGQPLHTHTNDMFINTSAAQQETGAFRGAFTNSYIFWESDFTWLIEDKYDENRGLLTATIENAHKSFPGREYDIHELDQAKRMRIYGQTDTDVNTNAVIFHNKVAHFDWLGHWLFGANLAESTLPEEWGKWAAHRLSHGDTKEPLNLQQAWQLGMEWVRENLSKRNETFAHHVARTPDEAYSMAKSNVIASYGPTDISCRGNCNALTQLDVVICTSNQGIYPYVREEYVFQSICGTKQDLSDPYGGALFRPGMR